MNEKLDFSKINTTIVYLLLSIITGVLFFFIIHNANWTWGDDYGFLISTGIGEKMWALNNDLGCIYNMGRFFPFGQLEYNILNFIPGGSTATAHYLLVAICIVIFVLISYILYFTTIKEAGGNTEFNPWLIILSIVFLLYYFFRIFFFLVYPERMIVVLLTLFVLLYRKFNMTNKYIYAIIAMTIAIYLIYCKETMFVVFTVILALNFLFGFKNLTKEQKFFYYVLGINVLVFLFLYYIISYRSSTVFYSRNSELKTLLPFTFGNLKLLYIGLLLSFWRSYRLFFKQDRQHLFFDSLLFSGLIYALALIVLNLQMVYYYFPAVTLVFPAIIYWLVRLVNPKWISLLMFIVVIYYCRKLPLAINNVQELRTMTHKNVEGLAKYIKGANEVLWYENKNINAVQAGQMGYQKEILSVYVHFYDHTIEKVPLKIINSLPDSMPRKTLIFYSANNIQKSSDMKVWTQTMLNQRIEKLNLNYIDELFIYYKK